MIINSNDFSRYHIQTHWTRRPVPEPFLLISNVLEYGGGCESCCLTLCRAFSQTPPLAIQTASPYRNTLHAANPSAAFGIDCYCAPGTLRRGLGNVLRYGATKHRLQHPDFVVNHSGTVSHLLILLSVFSPQRSSQTPPVRPFILR